LCVESLPVIVNHSLSTYW